MKRILLVSVGWLSVVLGVAGMFLPLLPTTPFLLLAAACFSRSSQRFYDWILDNRWCGVYIRNYREGRGVALRHKIAAIAVLWTTIGCTALFFVPIPWVKLLLIGIATAVTIHLLRLKTCRTAVPAPPSSTPPETLPVATNREL